MLNPYIPTNVQLLKRFLVFLTQEPLTIKGEGRSRGGGPMGSSFPNHDAKDQRTNTKEKEREKKRKRKEKPRADCKLAHKYIEITILYDP